MLTNKRLLDALARHQVYVEGLKADYYRKFNPFLDQLQKDIRYLLSKTDKRDLSSFTKKDLNKLIIELRDLQKKSYNVYTEDLLKSLRDLMSVENSVQKIMMASLKLDLDEPVDEDTANDLLDNSTDNTNMFPVNWFTKKEDEDKLWSSVTNAPIPANGILPAAFVASFTNSASNTIENIIRKGYANKTTVDDVLVEMFGTKTRNYKDGAFARIANQQNAVTSTVVQHISSYVSAGVQSIFFGKYRWVSVIDNSTTEICRGRNNKVFKYGSGPLPPAHIHCRSKTVPVVAGDLEDAPSYYTWAKSQPKEFLDDVLGKSKSKALLDGTTTAKDMPQFTDAKPITLDEFATKLDKILKR